MNREYLIDIAMDAYAEASGQSVSRPWMEAAFDAVAGRIWDEGYNAATHNAKPADEHEPGYAWDAYRTNPYETETP